MIQIQNNHHLKQLTHPVWIEIDLNQFKKNIFKIRDMIGSSLLCIPIKANAYGHGLKEIGLYAQSLGVDYLAVAHSQEGMELRKAGVSIPIIVLGAIHEDQISDLIQYQLEFSISSKYKADLVANQCLSLKNKCRVHLEVDTGMNRTGVRPETALHLFNHLHELPCFDIIGIYSHLASESIHDPFVQKQITLFETLLNNPIFKNKRLIRHLANTLGTCHFPESHFDMVRPSLLAFGYGGNSHIQPCFALKAKVSYFKVVQPDQGISYGHTYKTSNQTRIVTIPIGYGDGYRRALSNRGSVLIRGQRFPIVGTICMDQLMVDIGDAEVYVGDEVVLIGKQGKEEILLQEISSLCETIPYEILCSFNQRIPRYYLEI